MDIYGKEASRSAREINKFLSKDVPREELALYKPYLSLVDDLVTNYNPAEIRPSNKGKSVCRAVEGFFKRVVNRGFSFNVCMMGHEFSYVVDMADKIKGLEDSFNIMKKEDYEKRKALKKDFMNALNAASIVLGVHEKRPCSWFRAPIFSVDTRKLSLKS